MREGIPRTRRDEIVPPSTKPRPPGSHGIEENKIRRTQTAKIMVNETWKLIARKTKYIRRNSRNRQKKEIEKIFKNNFLLHKYLKLELKTLVDIFAFVLKNLKRYFSINFSILFLSDRILNAKKKPPTQIINDTIPIYKNPIEISLVADKNITKISRRE